MRPSRGPPARAPAPSLHGLSGQTVRQTPPRPRQSPGSGRPRPRRRTWPQARLLAASWIGRAACQLRARLWAPSEPSLHTPGLTGRSSCTWRGAWRILSCFRPAPRDISRPGSSCRSLKTGAGPGRATSVWALLHACEASSRTSCPGRGCQGHRWSFEPMPCQPTAPSCFSPRLRRQPAPTSRARATSPAASSWRWAARSSRGGSRPAPPVSLPAGCGWSLLTRTGRSVCACNRPQGSRDGS